MNHTNKLLDKYREVCSLRTDMAAAAKLGVGRGTVSAWRHGNRHAEPESVETMAKAAGLDAEEWVLRVQADRELLPARKQVWLRAAQRLAATAAIIALTFGLDVQTAKADFTKDAQNFANSSHYVYYVKFGTPASGEVPVGVHPFTTLTAQSCRSREIESLSRPSTNSFNDLSPGLSLVSVRCGPRFLAQISRAPIT